MRVAGALIVAGLLIFARLAFAAPLATTIADQGADAYSHPFDGLTDGQLDQFRKGRILFRQAWLMPPASDDADFVGLGPTYNDISCLGCHIKNGRGNAVQQDGEPPHGILIRLSIPGTDAHGGPKPHPAYGDQLNDHAVPGVPAEGRAHIAYRSKTIRYFDGITVQLRRPILTFSHLEFGVLGRGAMTSTRIAQPVFGLGLLDSLTQDQIENRVRRLHTLGDPESSAAYRPSGRVNYVWDRASLSVQVGRFGWKANQPSLIQQSAGAAVGDMGVTSPLFPDKNCPAVQTLCAKQPTGTNPNLSADRLAAMDAYVGSLAVPARRTPDRADVKRGEATFKDLGCGSCHAPSWTIEKSTRFPELVGQSFQPFTDLALHDMGSDLSDGRPDYAAKPREWRTPPLWGIGLALSLNPNGGFLHDGRARTIEEAILWHGGESTPVITAYRRLTKASRDDLLTFLNDL